MFAINNSTYAVNKSALSSRIGTIKLNDVVATQFTPNLNSNADNNFSDVITVQIHESNVNNLIYGKFGNDTIRIYGTFRDDRIYGDSGDDIIDGEEGNDYIFGDRGNDFILGGEGNDEIYGDTGNDEIYGEAGNDLIYGGDGNDVIYGWGGNDEIHGGSESDKIYGDEGNDFLYGDDGNDEISGGDGDDVISGGNGNDVIYGGAGKDTFIFDFPIDRMYIYEDTIMDFEVGSDILDFSKIDKAGIIQVGNNTKIACYNSDATKYTMIILEGVNSADLTEANFVGVNFADIIFK